VQGAISSTSSSKADSNNPLSGLVGHYHSDSEAEEEGREAAGKLDAKVSDFLKVNSYTIHIYWPFYVRNLFVHYIIFEKEYIVDLV